MKKVLKVLGYALLLVLVAAGAFASYVAATGIPRYPTGNVQIKVEPTPERVARGRKFAKMLCADCHMNPTTRQLTGKQLGDLPAQFGVAFSKNITQDAQKGLGTWTDGELIYLLRTGIDRKGQYLPPWMVKLPLMSDEDLQSIVAFLRSDDPMVAAVPSDPAGTTQPSFLTKLLTHTAFKPLPYPQKVIATPPVEDKVAYGRYLTSNLGCYSCHSADFKTLDDLEPEKSAGYFGGGNPLEDMNGEVVRSANITPDDETGIGKWSEEDLTRALRTGIRPDKTVLRYPMGLRPELTAEDSSAIYAFLRTVPKIQNRIPAPVRPVVADANEGKQIYLTYGCVGCHGKNGVGVADLRQAVAHYPTDSQLIAWIKNPQAIKPDTKMPAWEGVIPEDKFPALIAYVKELGAQ
ncbi:MAG: cytochrome c [Acidobacteriota bacterium]